MDLTIPFFPKKSKVKNLCMFFYQALQIEKFDFKKPLEELKKKELYKIWETADIVRTHLLTCLNNFPLLQGDSGAVCSTFKEIENENINCIHLVMLFCFRTKLINYKRKISLKSLTELWSIFKYYDFFAIL